MLIRSLHGCEREIEQTLRTVAHTFKRPDVLHFTHHESVELDGHLTREIVYNSHEMENRVRAESRLPASCGRVQGKVRESP